MRFEILHTTDYRYSDPAIEAYLETRLTPPDTSTQKVLSHTIEFQPSALVSSYADWFGNCVAFYSWTLRHERLSIVNRAVVETIEPKLPRAALAMPVAEARQLFSSALLDFYDYLQPTDVVPVGGMAAEWARRYLGGSRPLEEGLDALTTAIYRTFTYQSGSTDNSTPLKTVWRQKKGVCQDFAHIMLSVVRTAGLPARYVCGYIECEPLVPPPAADGKKRRRLVGSLATHAWVEVLVPGMEWVAFDPTNNQWCKEQHVAVSFGRDFRDAAPVRGTFKGSGGQVMKVKVRMKRLLRKP